MVLRSFTGQVSHTRPDGVEIPLKLVRGWVASDRTLYPLDEAAMFDAHCMDAASGEPLPQRKGWSTRERRKSIWPCSTRAEGTERPVRARMG